MRDQKAVLRYFLHSGWIVNGQNIFYKLNHENISDFDILLNENYQTTNYYFNTFGDPCVIIEEQEFALSKTTSYDIEF